VYQSSTPEGPLALTGVLTLNGAGVYIFQTGSTLTANTGSTFVLEGGASACNVFWQVGSQATLNGPTFVGTVMANTTIAVGSAVTVDGRLLAQTAEVTLIDDTINASACFTAVSSPTPSPGTGTPTTGAGAGIGGGALLAISGLALLGAGAVLATIRRRRWTSPL